MSRFQSEVRRTNRLRRRRQAVVQAFDGPRFELLENRVLLSVAPLATTTTIDHSSGFAGALDANTGDMTGNPSAGDPTMLPRVTDVADMNGGPALFKNVLQLTDGGGGQSSNAWSNTQQGIDSFDTTFDFTFGNTTPPAADGFTFTIQNSPAGTGQTSGGGGSLGYSGIPQSVGIKFDLYPAEDQTGVYLNGAGITDDAIAPTTTAQGPGVNIDLTKNTTGGASGIDFHANPADRYEAHLVYDGTTSTLTETVSDVTKGASVTQKFTVNIPAAVNSHTAYVGFTGATGGAVAEQDIISWKFTGTQTGTGAVQLPAPVLSGNPSIPGSVVLHWTNITGNETGFEIDRATSPGGPFTMVTTVPTGTANYTDTGLDTTKTYSYEIKAIGDGMNNSDSPFSNVVTVTGAGLQTTPINHANGFAGATDFQLNGTAKITGASDSVPNALELTSAATGGNEDGSAFDKNLQLVNKFDTTFTFVFGPNHTPDADGFTFAINGGALTARGGGGGGLGYSGINNSVAVKFDLWENGGPTATTTGVFVNGAVSDGDQPIDATMPADTNTSITLSMNAQGQSTGIDFHANPNDHYQVHLVYDGTTLTETVTDLDNKATVTQAYTVDIPGTVGDVAAVGFTGADGGAVSQQDITSWSFPTATAPQFNKADFNHSGKVDFADLLILAQNYGKTGTDNAHGDANGDGKVDFADLLILAQNYGKTGPQAGKTRGSLLSDVVGLVKTH